MANKHRIEDIDAALEQSLRKLSMLVTRINELRRKRRAIVAGRMKQPPPAGVKKLIALHKAGEFSFDDDVSDIGERPIAPGGAGPC